MTRHASHSPPKPQSLKSYLHIPSLIDEYVTVIQKKITIKKQVDILDLLNEIFNDH